MAVNQGGDRRRSDVGRQTNLGSLIELSDVLNKPQEALLFDTNVITMPVRPHWHYYMEIIYMLRGGMIVESDGVTQLVRAGDFYMVRPEVVHCFFQNEERRAVCEILKFDVSRLHSGNSYVPKMDVILRKAGNEQHAPMYFPKKQIAGLRIGDTMARIREELENKEYGYDLMVQSLISMIMTEIVRLWREKGINLDVAIAEDTEGISIHNITAYIDNHAGEDLRVEQLAGLCSMSYSYFARSFHSLYGRSCKEYIEHIRISKAEDLLLFTNCDLSYISQETGFADSSHLIKTFRRLKGVTPKQYKTGKRVQ
ncbi:helix-turn-helix transcriptional regulator [Lachnoclostridium sp. Marseille-P6806]|uniref:helix-turn-helix transcriptional regulator n=1 Tax=Lachnoclostridium sp. Marseille-P6806 TaxID=2364793 RepID=UPI0013EF5154|nr:helix-turn-helix domain-containing protein [Lachnoclostridium sp. Marseille-P6806]